MTEELRPLQYDLFSGNLVDNRSDYQKKKDKVRTAPQQIQMFSTPEIVQFGNMPKSAYRDWIEVASVPVLTLIAQDVRTPEEVERDLIREAEKKTVPLFGDDPDIDASVKLSTAEKEQPVDIVIFDARTRHLGGLRARFRTQSIRVRPRTTQQLLTV